MSFEIVLGWWLLPAIVTVLAFTWATAKQDHSRAGDYGRVGQGIGNAFLHGVALLVSMFAWLVWALLT